jgi:hypothetical protein
MPRGQRPNAKISEDLGTVGLHVPSRIETTGPVSAIRRAALVYPCILVGLFVLLVAGGVSGSSVAILSDSARDPGLVLGSPQSVREDEWDIGTPYFIGQMVSGERATRLVGVGEHDLSVLADLPTRDWSVIFRPDNLASMVLPTENALAWNWWLPMLVSALAFYGIAVLCGLGLGLSTCISMLISFSPLVEWWHSNSITGSLGFGSAACFSILMLLRAKSRPRAFLWSASSFYWMFAFALVLYPPFQISTLLALIPITIAIVVADIGTKRYTWAHALALIGAVGFAAGIGVATFVFVHRDAITAIQGTAYPGLRQSSGGGGSLTQLFSANFSPVLAQAPPLFGGTNLSEISAPYLFAAESLVVLLLAGWQRTNTTARNVAVASAASLALGLAWHQLPIPSSVGRFFLLDLVPAYRVLPLIGISGAFLLAVLVHSQILRLSARRRVLVGVLVGSTSFCLAMIEALKIRSLLPTLSLSALIAAAILGAVAIAALAAAPRKWGVVAVATMVGIGFLNVNPLYRGTGALEHSDIAQAIRREGTGATWVNYGNPVLEAFLAASGASSLSGVNYYPNSDGWRRLLGEMRSQPVWNRYLKTIWHTGSNRAEVSLAGNDWAEIRLSPCAPQLTGFGVTNILAPAGTFSARDACLHPITSASWHGGRYVIYARST